MFSGNSAKIYLTASTGNSYFNNGGNVGIGTTNPAEKLDVNGYVKSKTGYLDRNLLDTTVWTISTSGIGGFSGNQTTPAENERVWGTDPFGRPTMLWKSVNDVLNDSDGGWDYSNIPVTPNKAYRLTVWVKKDNTSSGTVYFGCNGGNTLNLSNVADTNPYFLAFASSNLVANRWYLLVAYIHANNDASTTSYSGVYDGVTGQKVIAGTDFKNSTGTVQTHRVYNFYDTTTGSIQYFWGPRFEEINGNEPPIEALLGMTQGATGGSGTTYFSGNVGIGTTVFPGSSKLSVNGKISGPTYSMTYLDLTGGQAVLTGNNGVRLQNNGADVLTVDTNSNVGIGTTSPGAHLDLTLGTAEFTGGFRISNIVASNNMATILRNGSHGGADLTLYNGANPSSATVLISGGASANSYFNTGGNVGIGTTSPFTRLSNYNADVIDSSNWGTDPVGFLWSTAGSSSGYVGAFENRGNNTARNVLLLKTATVATNADILRAESGGVNRLTVRSDGNVGIGTTSPGALLHTEKLLRTNNLTDISSPLYSFNDGYLTAATSTQYLKGVFGRARGQSSNFIDIPIGVLGYGSNRSANGRSSTTYGVYGLSEADPSADSNNTISGYGVYGTGNLLSGATGTGNTYNLYGLYGNATSADPGSGWTVNNYGVYATASSGDTNWAGYFVGNVYASANVGIGTTGPGAPLHVNGVSSGKIAQFSANSGTYQGYLYIGSPSGSDWRIGKDPISAASGYFGIANGAGSSQYLTIDTSGNVGIGTATPGNILTVVQSSATDPIADAWTTYSSRRWKENIQPMEGALDKVLQLRGVTYDWKADSKHDLGMIAEEVGEIVPELVEYEENGVDAKSIDYGRLTAVLVEALKEQQKQLDELKAANEELRRRLDALDTSANQTP